MGKGWWILIGGVVAIGTSIGIYSKTQYDKLVKTCFLTSGVLIKELKSDHIVMDLMIKVSNKSDVAINIIRPKFLVYMNGILISKMSGKDMRISNNACSSVNIDIDFVPAEVFGASMSVFQDILFQKSKVKLKTIGLFDIKVSGISAKDITYETEITLKELFDGDSEEVSPCKC